MLVTPHFDTSEWMQPAMYGLPSVEYPIEWTITRLTPLCDLLEELRHYLLCPIQIISGYRTEEWNNRHIAAGHNAAKGSMHIHGVAADIQVHSFSSFQIYDSIMNLNDRKRLRVGGIGLYSDFVHVDVRYILDGMPSGVIQWKG